MQSMFAARGVTVSLRAMRRLAPPPDRGEGAARAAMFTPMLRTMSATASDERGEGWPSTSKATSQLYASVSLPELRTLATRSRRLPTPPNPRLPTPSTSRPTLDLELPKIPKGMSQSKSLSALSLVANRRQEQLQVILNRSASLGQAGLDESAARLLAAADSERAFQKVSDEIGLLQASAAGIYGAPETPASRAAAAAAREAAFAAANPEVVARKKEEVRKRRQAQLQEMLKKAGRGTSGHHEAVQRKLEELRTDDEARLEFEAYIKGLKGPPMANVIQRNIAKVRNLTTSQLLAVQVERLQQSIAKRTVKEGQVREQRERRQAAELAAVQADLKRREAERRERLNRAGIAEVQGRCAQWMAVMVVARSAADFHRHVVEGRTRDTNRRATSAAAERVQRRWRFHLIPLRLRKIVRGLRVLRRRVFWWRIRQRIIVKRRSLLLLGEFLRACAEATIARRIKQFRYKAVKLQRAWRHIAIVLRAQLQVTLLAWDAHELRTKRGVGAAKDEFKTLTPQELQEARVQVAGEDLTRRRREYRTRLDEWMVRERDREKVVEMEAIWEEARELLNGSALTVQRMVRGRAARQGMSVRKQQADGSVFLTETHDAPPTAQAKGASRRAPLTPNFTLPTAHCP